MGRLSVEIENSVREYYIKNNGFLINISEWKDSVSASQRVGDFCNECKFCLASYPVISLGEITSQLKNSGLFAVGLIDIKDKTVCPLVKNF